MADWRTDLACIAFVLAALAIGLATCGWMP